MDYCAKVFTSGVPLNESDHQYSTGRHGMIHGKCEQGYSAVFGSLNFRQCTNVRVFSTSLCNSQCFTNSFNFTVVDGDINDILLYVYIQLFHINFSISSYCDGKFGSWH